MDSQTKPAHDSAEASSKNMPKVTAAICTRNRGDQIVETVRSILESEYPDFTLLIVDQSTNQETATAVAPFLSDPRVRYLHSTTKGLGTAHNICLAEASTDIIIITDDDCTVPKNWLSVMANIFVQNPDVAVAFCNVAPAPHDQKEGFIPFYMRSGEQKLTRIKDKMKARAIGAGLSVRRSHILQMGGFDSELGPGARFPSCDDGDIAVRALLMGYAVYETDQVAVLHYGYRTFAEGKNLARRDWVAIGAAYAKPLKMGYTSFWVVPAYEFFRFALWPPLHDLLHLRRPVGFSRITAFLSGFKAGMQTRVDPRTLRFREQDQTGEPGQKLFSSPRLASQ